MYVNTTSVQVQSPVPNNMKSETNHEKARDWVHQENVITCVRSCCCRRRAAAAAAAAAASTTFAPAVACDIMRGHCRRDRKGHKTLTRIAHVAGGFYDCISAVKFSWSKIIRRGV